MANSTHLGDNKPSRRRTEENALAEDRILLIQLRQLGDILLTTPCIRAVKRERPRAKVTVLTHAMGRLILDNCPYVDEHFFYEDSWSIKDHLRLARTLRERNFDLVFDFMNNPRSALLTMTTGAKERVAFRSARRPAYTQTLPRPPGGEYIVRDKFKLLEAAGFRPTDVGLVLPWFELHTHPMLRLFGANDRFRNAGLRVALSPTHRREARRWPLAAWASLADRLTREWGAACLWLHGPGEEPVIDEVMALCKEPSIRAPKTSFRELAALVANCDLFIGNSNGPSHVAVSTDICSLQLHGPTSGRAWCPDTPRHRFVQAETMEQLSGEQTWAALAAMQPEIEAFAKTARTKGPRVTWRS